MAEKAIIMFQKGNERPQDLEVPLDISAEELIWAMNVAYSLGIAVDKLPESYMKAENPIVLIHGKKTLEQLGIHDGSIIHFEL